MAEVVGALAEAVGCAAVGCAAVTVELVLAAVAFVVLAVAFGTAETELLLPKRGLVDGAAAAPVDVGEGDAAADWGGGAAAVVVPMEVGEGDTREVEGPEAETACCKYLDWKGSDDGMVWFCSSTLRVFAVMSAHTHTKTAISN